MGDKKRIDFKSGIPFILAKKANFKCSVPRCKTPTVGPFKENEGAVNLGVACHIYSASENGPRGWGGKTEDFISSEENGIWCCQYHASLIDKNEGKDYPVSVLFAWKKLIEARILKEMNDIPSPLGWIESIAFTSFLNRPIIPKLNLSRYTLIHGENGVGKTVLLEIAAAISNSKYADRFNGTQILDKNNQLVPAEFKAQVNYSTVDTFSKDLKMEIINKRLYRIENSQACLLSPGDLEVIYCSSKDLRRNDDEDDIDYMMRILNVDKSALFSLADIGTKTLLSGKIKFVHATEFDEDDFGEEKEYLKYKKNGEDYYELKFLSDNFPVDVSFKNLSSSEQGKLVLDLQIMKSREVAKQRLTLLLIEGLILTFDKYNFQKLLEILIKEDFQVVVSIPPYLYSEIISNDELIDVEYLYQWKLEGIGKT